MHGDNAVHFGVVEQLRVRLLEVGHRGLRGGRQTLGLLETLEELILREVYAIPERLSAKHHLQWHNGDAVLLYLVRRHPSRAVRYKRYSAHGYLLVLASG